MSFKNIFCQDKALNLLQRAFIADKIAGAYIFTGPQGVGKEKTAVQFATLLLCSEPTIEKNSADSCGRCRSCSITNLNSHPDYNLIYKELLEFTKDGKGKTPVQFPIDVIREFLIEKIYNKPTLSKRKVFIITEAEKLNIPSQNALLKSLEEPPGYCTIILICTQLEDLLPTTRSRCQVIRFGRIKESFIIEKLKSIGLNDEPARYFARLCRGRLGLACQWAKLERADANLYKTKKNIVERLTNHQLQDSLELAQSLLKKSKKIAASWADIETATSKPDITRQAHKTLIEMVIAAFTDAMKINIDPNSPLINADQPKHIQRLAARFNPEQAARKITQAANSMLWVERAVNEKLIFEQLLLNLADSDTIKV